MAQYDPTERKSNHLSTRLGLGVMLATAVLLWLLLVPLILPWIVLIGLVLASGFVWRRYCAFQAKLYECFYTCLQAHNGRLNVLEFAMAARIPGRQARTFLDARAQDFFAEFEPTSYGDIVYHFVRSSSPGSGDRLLKELSHDFIAVKTTIT
jgi:hypothetical protein